MLDRKTRKIYVNAKKTLNLLQLQHEEVAGYIALEQHAENKQLQKLEKSIKKETEYIIDYLTTIDSKIDIIQDEEERIFVRLVLCSGLSYADLSEKLFYCEGTIKNKFNKIMRENNIDIR